MRSVVAFLKGRLEKKETIEWAVGLGPNEIVKRQAVLHWLDRDDGTTLREPWRSAWRLIEESWEEPIGRDDSWNKMKVRERLHSGDRSGTLVSAIVDLVAPRLVVEPYSPRARQYQDFPKRPRTFRDMFFASLKSAKIVNPSFLGLEQLIEGQFIVYLANALDTAVARGLDIARRLGRREREHLSLRRVYYASECKSNEDRHEPDAFREGIAPSVKLLYAVVSRLIDVDRPAALRFVSRWKQIDSPVHLRLWAAMSRDPRITPAMEVGEFLLKLDQGTFWGAQYYPEIAELRARRFGDLDDAAQNAVAKKIRKGPSRKLWRKGTEAKNIEKVRVYWIVRELKRIEVAGTSLPPNDKIWLESNIGAFPELAEMDRVDERDISKTPFISATPDRSLDFLAGIDRLKALEQALSRPSRGLDDDPASRAYAWLSEENNPAEVLKDIESSRNGGADFPRVWEHFGWAHLSPAEQERKTKEARQVLGLLTMLPKDTLSKAVRGITDWLYSWRKIIVVVESNWSGIWLRVWPLAVETTNADQSPNEAPKLNVEIWISDDDDPQNLDTLNPPAAKLIDVFLAALLADLSQNTRPFDNPCDLRTVRDHVVNASGRSGLIAKHRLIELLGYFLRADENWTQEHLIAPLRANNGEALALWRAVSRQTQFKDVLRIIGDDMAVRTKDRDLDRDTRGSLAFSLVVESLYALWDQREPVVEDRRVQQMIRSLDDEEVRISCAEAIVLFLTGISSPGDQKPNPPSREDLFQSVAKPFLQKVWPQERSLTSPGLSQVLAQLPAIACGRFVEAAETVERFLMPFACWSMSDYALYGSENGAPKLEIIDDGDKANALLRLLDQTVGTAENAVIPYDLGDALDQIRKVAPHLAQAPAYRRLETAARRTR